MSELTMAQRVAQAWGGIENPILDKVNPHFGNKYASLKATQAVIREACRPVGLVYRQRLYEGDDGRYRLDSSVMSDAGEVEPLSTFPVETPPNPQAFGSNLTYAKRQQAQADWGITGEEDDDGEAAAIHAKTYGNRQTPPQTGQKRPQNAESRRPGRFDKVSELKARAIALGITEEGIKSWIEATFKGKPMKDFTQTEITAVEGYLQTLIRDKESLEGGQDAGE